MTIAAGEFQFVVIYDYDTDDGIDEECYYGYFDSVEQAERLYREMIHGCEAQYRNARVCRVVKDL